MSEADFHLGTGGHGLCDILEDACLDEGCFGHAGCGIPLEFAHGQAVAIRCQKGDVAVFDFEAHAGEQGQGLIARCCNGHLGHCLGEHL